MSFSVVELFLFLSAVLGSHLNHDYLYDCFRMKLIRQKNKIKNIGIYPHHLFRSHLFNAHGMCSAEFSGFLLIKAWRNPLCIVIIT